MSVEASREEENAPLLVSQRGYSHSLVKSLGGLLFHTGDGVRCLGILMRFSHKVGQNRKNGPFDQELIVSTHLHARNAIARRGLKQKAVPGFASLMREAARTAELRECKRL